MNKLNNETFIIFEAGINHNGSRTILTQLIDGAIDAKASAIKFQKRTIDLVYTKEFLDSPRNDGNLYGWKTQRDQKMGLELTKADFDFIDEYCRGKILWSASCWDIPSQLFLRQYNVAFNKIASPILTNLSLLETVAEEGKYTYISTGMSTLDEIQNAVDIFKKHNCPFSLLHCNSCYPALNKYSNLPMIDILRMKFDCKVGYSSHEDGRVIAVAAVARGASCIEKHGTISKNMYGSDQKASLELDQFKKMVIDIREIEPALNIDVTKNFSEAELEVRKKLRGN